LQNNGGQTQTMAPGNGSAALDQIPATGAQCPAADQRSITRPQGPACDIGAFEAKQSVTATPETLTFLSQATGSTSAAQTVTVTETGESPAVVSAVDITGPDAGDFKVASNACQTVNAGASCAMGVTFSPTAIGTRTASLTVTDTAGTQTVSLSGTGAAPGGGSTGGNGAAPTARLVSATVSGTHATLTIACGTGAGHCAVKGALTITEKLKGRKIVAVGAAGTHANAKTKSKTVTLATGSATINANASSTITLTLSKAGARLLAAHHKLKATLTVTQTGTGTSVTIATRTLTFNAVKKKKKKKRSAREAVLRG
jgi:hypothetical protein